MIAVKDPWPRLMQLMASLNVGFCLVCISVIFGHGPLEPTKLASLTLTNV